MHNIDDHSKISAPSLAHHPLRSLKQLYGLKLAASDGDIGHVKDFYFDDQRWAVRYVVVDTGSWLPGRLVLISPHAFGDFYQDGDWLLVNQTRKQIETSPAIESHKPVSRQYEAEYYRHYGYPSYWNGIELWGGAGFPMAPLPELTHTGAAGGHDSSLNGEDPHLRSVKELGGYDVHTGDGPIGHVADLLIDEKSWAVRQMVIETGHWFSGKEIVLSPSLIDRISYEESAVFVTVTKEAIAGAAEYQMPRAAYHEAWNS